MDTPTPRWPHSDVFRVLITGSRDWPYPFVVEAALESVAHFVGGPKNLIVVHGACPTGADHQADRWAARSGAAIAAYPARWNQDGRAAGFIRNQRMVDLGADMCLAFIGPCAKKNCPQGPRRHGSHGAVDCADRAQSDGIRTARHEIWKTY